MARRVPVQVGAMIVMDREPFTGRSREYLIFCIPKRNHTDDTGQDGMYVSRFSLASVKACSIQPPRVDYRSMADL